MNAHQRRKDRRRLDRFASAVIDDLVAHEICKATMVDGDRAVMGPALTSLFESMLPPELRQYAPTVEWR